MYIDDYATCAETYASLAVFHDGLDPSIISQVLVAEPSEIATASRDLILHCADAQRPAVNFFSTRGVLYSLDARRHIDWVVARAGERREAIRMLLGEGYQIEILCFWLSRWDQGGPTLSSETMSGIAGIGVELTFQFAYEHELEEPGLES